MLIDGEWMILQLHFRSTYKKQKTEKRKNVQEDLRVHDK